MIRGLGWTMLAVVQSVSAPPPAPQVPARVPPVTAIVPVSIHDGVNRVPGLLDGGGTGTIIRAWSGNGNAHGHRAYMVLAGPPEATSVGVVGVEYGEFIVDGIADHPFDGERVRSAVRFARARLAGKPVALLIQAELNDAASPILADHVTATVTWYRLDHSGDAVGRPADVFLPIGRVVTGRRYCNADLAMRDTAGVPLPADFAGANRDDGCFASR